MNLPHVLRPLIATTCAVLLVSPCGDAVAAAPRNSAEVVPICDLLRRLDAFDGKIVAVRGAYRFSPELAGLYSEGCQNALVLDGFERTQALETEFTGASAEQRAAFAHFTEAVDRIAKAGGRQAIHVTFVGKVVTRNPGLHRVGQRKGERMFGHLGIYPARLEVREVENITIEEAARQPSNMELPR